MACVANPILLAASIGTYLLSTGAAPHIRVDPCLSSLPMNTNVSVFLAGSLLFTPQWHSGWACFSELPSPGLWASDCAGGAWLGSSLSFPVMPLSAVWEGQVPAGVEWQGPE